MLTTMFAAFTAWTARVALVSVAFALPSACDRSNANSTQPEFDAARAWQLLERTVAIGPRASGSAGIEKTRELITAELTAAGLKPVREAFTATTPAGAI